MSLTFYFHPLASFCHKVLIALYENDTSFEPVIVDLGDPQSTAEFKAVWPMAKFPVLVDAARKQTVAESTIVVEYLDALHPGRTRFVPADADAAWQVRMWDRFLDYYIHQPMQKIVTDRLRPAGKNDPVGVEDARIQLREAYAFVEQSLAGRIWAVGEKFSLADCSAAPALFYANTVEPFAADQTWLAAYNDRLMLRPSYARALTEAEPYFRFFPMEKKPVVKRDGGGDASR